MWISIIDRKWNNEKGAMIFQEMCSSVGQLENPLEVS